MELDVPPAAAGQRLDVFLGARLGSRSQAQRLLEQGAVSVDGDSSPAKRRLLSGGELITVSMPAIAQPAGAEQAEFAVVLEDHHLLVVDKPAGVVVHPARGHREGTLSQALAARGAAGGDPWRAGIVHRLDMHTSGLLVVAKSDECHRRLKSALAAREITREYLALVDGRPPARAGTIDAPLGRDRRVRTRISTDTAEPRAAITHFELVESLSGCSLLRVRLDTGRTHQIRAHFLAIGHPVCGDPEYGARGRLGLSRQFLHAARLAFPHPFDAAAVDVASPLPADLAAALELARRGEWGTEAPHPPT
ncbi:MAG: RluA family pseudouridine synthase [Solirubrobacteraceae bacterium]